MTPLNYKLILLLTLAALLSSCGRSGAIESDQISILSDPYEPKTLIMEWTGEIEPPMAAMIIQEFELRADDFTRVTVSLNSPGGLVNEGKKVIKAINKMKLTHSVHTYVGPDNDCLSMCVPIFLQGRVRIASASSNWMFHEPSVVSTLNGAKVVVYEHEKRRSSLNVYHEFFKNSEMNPKWQENLRRQWRYGDVWKTGEELKQERSNIVTILED